MLILAFKFITTKSSLVNSQLPLLRPGKSTVLAGLEGIGPMIAQLPKQLGTIHHGLCCRLSSLGEM
jgi:hypothetical protein